MTDKELIARLRQHDGWVTLEAHTHLTAADRIEALTKERDEADDLAKAAFADGASNNIRLAETSYRVKWLEAKLAKAVEGLKRICMQPDYRLPSPQEIARATLVEIKGESHDVN